MFLFHVNCSDIFIESTIQLVQQGSGGEAHQAHLHSGDTQMLS